MCLAPHGLGEESDRAAAGGTTINEKRLGCECMLGKFGYDAGACEGARDDMSSTSR